jgi:glycosyltransferase involved in cell wall biosynthesis
MVIKKLREKNDTVDILELRKLPYLLAPLQVLSPRIHKIFRYALLHREETCIVFDELVHPSVFIAAAFLKKTGARIYLLVHHLKSKEQIGCMYRLLARFFEKVLVNSVDMIIANSNITALTVKKLLRHPSQIEICPPGGDTLIQETSSPTGTKIKSKNKEKRDIFLKKQSEGCVRFLSVGNVIPRKGYLNLLKFLSNISDLNDMNWHFTIAGDDHVQESYTRILKKFIQRSSLQKNITFTGIVGKEELITLYQKSDVFLFPSEYEGYGISLAEALSFGLPYIAMECGAISEITGNEIVGSTSLPEGVKRTKGGFLINPNNQYRLIDVLKKIITDENLRKKLSEEARILFASLNTWNDTCECFYRTIHSSAQYNGIQ